MKGRESSQMKGSGGARWPHLVLCLFQSFIFELHVSAWEMDFNIRQGLLGTRQVWQMTGWEVLPELALLVSLLPGFVLMKGSFNFNYIRNEYLFAVKHSNNTERAKSLFWGVGSQLVAEQGIWAQSGNVFHSDKWASLWLGSFPLRNLSWRHEFIWLTHTLPKWYLFP